MTKAKKKNGAITKHNQLTINTLVPNQLSVDYSTTTYVGIDFGTSTTVVSIAAFDNEQQNIKLKTIRLDQLLEDGTRFQGEKLPSVIAWHNECLLVGEGASNLKYTLQKGKNIWYSFKMEIGEDLGAKYFDSEVANVEPINIRNPKDCVRVFFMYLKMLITRYCEQNGLSTNIAYAISIPASFEANQRKELMEALETNGMTVSKQSLIDEPNAAFISYVNESQDSEQPLLINPNYNPKVLVFDFGGGTCDISILEIGKSVNGFYSKNLSISKFTKLGGDDIDRYLTYQYLLPRFLKHNGLSKDKFRSKELKVIASKLYKIAEKIKINSCRALALLTSNFKVPATKENDKKNAITMPITIETSKGTLQQDEFYITNKELTETMNVFVRNRNRATIVERQEEYNNIFMPIKSAIDKANIDAEEIDYVLLIGGSAQNPYIQEVIHEYFSESDILVPRDLQTHVSRGAAIHSLLVNSLGKSIIEPITSEPIIIITKDSCPRVLVPAGTIIPCDTISINDLRPANDQQEAIEIPLCIGNKNKMLQNIKITRPNKQKFPYDATITVTVEITADKLLIAQAECMGVRLMVEPQNPFSNKELTTEERAVLNAERTANLEAEANGGIPSKSCLINLKEAYIAAGNNYKAAETLELINEIYPNTNSLNSIGVLYHNAGAQEKAIEFYKQAIEVNPDDFWPRFNLGHSLFHSNPTESAEHLNHAYNLNPNEPTINVMLGRQADREGNKEQAQIHFRKAYDTYKTKWENNNLNDVDCGWFASVAEELGEKNYAREIRLSAAKTSKEEYYNDDNLTITKSKALTE